MVDTTGPRKCVLIRARGTSLFQSLISTQKYAIGTSETVLIREVSFVRSSFKMTTSLGDTLDRNSLYHVRI